MASLNLSLDWAHPVKGDRPHLGLDSSPTRIMGSVMYKRIAATELACVKERGLSELSLNGYR